MNKQVTELSLVNPRLLFKPTGSLDWQQDFAQIPFGYTEGNHLRVIFATRSAKDQNGNYKSYPAQAIFDLSDLSLQSLDSSPLMDLGQPGSFDESGVMPGTITKLHSGEVAMYYCGWSRSVVTPYRWSIGVSFLNSEGKFIRRDLGPVIGQSIAHPYLVASPVVFAFDSSTYEMFHLTGTSWDFVENKYEALYRITRSTSGDGHYWNSSGWNMEKVFWADECQTSPNIFMIGNKRFMTFSYRSQSGFRNNLDRNYKTAVAEEISSENWRVIQSKVGVIDGISQRFDVAYLNTFEHQGCLYGLYNYSAGFGTSGIYIAQIKISI